MKAKTPATSLLVVAPWLGALACWTDNEPEYQGIEAVRQDRQANDDATAADVESSDPVDTGNDTDGNDSTETEPDVDAGSTDDESSTADAPMSSADDVVGTDGSMSTDTGTDAAEPTDAIGDTNMDEDPNSDCATSFTPVNPDSEYYPPCCLAPALNGEEVKKGTQCTTDDVQHCYRVCGPFQLGWKTEDCLAGVYAEGDCGFPVDDPTTKETLSRETGREDYSCFSIPDEIDTSVCPQDAPPKSTDECDVPECTPCNLRDLYRDTNDNTKEGYCVCRPPDENGVRYWTCASVTAWPCPFSEGCG